jgi:hypothetical protein
MDDIEKVDIGDRVVPRPTFVSMHLNTSQKQEIIELLKAHTCCFAWDYTEMPGIRRELIEHRLPIKADFRSYKTGSPEHQARDHRKGEGKGGLVAASQVHTAMSLCNVGF